MISTTKYFKCFHCEAGEHYSYQDIYDGSYPEYQTCDQCELTYHIEFCYDYHGCKEKTK